MVGDAARLWAPAPPDERTSLACGILFP